MEKEVRSARGRKDRPGSYRIVRESPARASGGSPESKRGYSSFGLRIVFHDAAQPIRWTTPRLFLAPGLKCSPTTMSLRGDRVVGSLTGAARTLPNWKNELRQFWIRLRVDAGAIERSSTSHVRLQ